MQQSCDRTYEHALDDATSTRGYTLKDRAWGRSIEIEVAGSRSVVVWHPGRETALKMPDVPHAGWSDFLCVEAANAGRDVVLVAPGGQHRLTQRLTVTGLG